MKCATTTFVVWCAFLTLSLTNDCGWFGATTRRFGVSAQEPSAASSSSETEQVCDCDCSSECDRLSQIRVETARQEAGRQLAMTQTQAEDAHQRVVQELEATWNDRLARQLQDKETELLQQQDRVLQERIQVVEKEWKDRQELDVSLRERAEALVKQLQAELDTSAASSVAQEDLQKQLDNRNREVVRQKERVKSIQAALEDSEREVRKFQEKYFSTRQDLFRVNQIVRDMEASASYVNATMIWEDASHVVTHMAGTCSYWWNATVTYLRPKMQACRAAYLAHVAPVLRDGWNKTLPYLSQATKSCRAAYKNQVVPFLHDSWNVIVKYLQPATEASRTAYVVHVSPFLHGTIRPVLKDFLEWFFQARSIVFQRVNVVVKQGAQFFRSYLELQDGDSKTRSFLMDACQIVEEKSDAVVDFMKGIFYFLVLMLMLWMVRRRKRTKKPAEKQIRHRKREEKPARKQNGVS